MQIVPHTTVLLLCWNTSKHHSQAATLLYSIQKNTNFSPIIRNKIYLTSWTNAATKLCVADLNLRYNIMAFFCKSLSPSHPLAAFNATTALSHFYLNTNISLSEFQKKPKKTDPSTLHVPAKNVCVSWCFSIC